MVGNQINRSKFLISFDGNKTLNENYDLLDNSNDDVIFDFVITENQKYVIFADNLISKDLGYIGNIWENAWVINEIINENINKGVDVIEESIVNSIVWTKELFLECVVSLDDDGLLIEQWDWIKKTAGKAWSGVKKVGSAVGKGVANFAKSILMKGFLPLLRWIRKNAYTMMGTIVDVVSAIIPVTSGINKLIWAMIVILDIFEITTGNFDPKDEERKQDPYSGLLIDLISFVFAAAVGLTSKTAIRAVKAGKPMSNFLKSTLTKFKNMLPGISNSLKSFGDLIIKYIPGAKKVVSTVMSGVNKVLSGVDTFISQLFSKKGAIAVTTGVAIGIITKPIVLGIGDSGKDVTLVNNFFKDGIQNGLFDNKPECIVDPKTITGGSNYDKNTESAVKKYSYCFNKTPDFSKYTQLRTDGKIDNAGLQGMGIQMDERGVMKHVPNQAKESLGKAAKAGSDMLKKLLTPISKSNKQV
jgi:uncharacterized membrane protein